MGKVRRSKTDWNFAVGAFSKVRRLKLNIDEVEMVYKCPVISCDHIGFSTQRGCRKHVCYNHGWYYYFDEKPQICDAFPQDVTGTTTYVLPKRTNTQQIPCFDRDIPLSVRFQQWLRSEVCSGKSVGQAMQISVRVLKFMKFCCKDVPDDWNPSDDTLDYCIGSVQLVNDFITELREKWTLGYSGTIGYLDAISHTLDYRRLNARCETTIRLFTVAEVLICRIRKCICRKMRIEWNSILSVEYLEGSGCWSSLEEMATVIPYHAQRFNTIISNRINSGKVAASEISFATAFIATLLFVEVKASRPMTYQGLTVGMLESVKENGFIDQTLFKTNHVYGFDSLYFESEVLIKVNSYIKHLRPLLFPKCPYLLVTRNGTQHTQLSNLFSRIVFSQPGNTYIQHATDKSSKPKVPQASL